MRVRRVIARVGMAALVAASASACFYFDDTRDRQPEALDAITVEDGQALLHVQFARISADPHYSPVMYDYGAEGLRVRDSSMLPAAYGELRGAPTCVPQYPHRCFRPLAGEVGVEASTDGGDTWAVSWRLTSGERAFLAERYGMGLGWEESFVTKGLAVAKVGNTFEVLAANGPDGFAVRDVYGNWQRTAWSEWGVDDAPEFVPLPGELALAASPTSDSLGRDDYFPWQIVWAVVAFVVIMLVAEFTTPRGVKSGSSL